jgi:organic radical activating enzyme
MTDKIHSYTAANALPLKILKNEELMRSLNKCKVIPWHIQLNLTNACNFKCDFCSCANRDKALSLPFSEVAEMMKMYRKLGMDSVTITGGGETTLYPELSKVLKLLHELNVDVGLVTNGSLLHTLSEADLNRIHWLRISVSDILHRQLKIDDWFNSINQAVSKDNTIGWAFSYVVSSYPNFTFMKKIINYANDHNFTHVRLVSDLLDIKSISNMSAVRGGLLDLGVDVSKVIFQGRKTFVHGFTPCYISLLKPVVGADGLLYACCGSQYSQNDTDKNYVNSMGHWRDLPKLVEEQKFFDGAKKCIKCYYEDYQFIGQIIASLDDERFV